MNKLDLRLPKAGGFLQNVPLGGKCADNLRTYEIINMFQGNPFMKPADYVKLGTRHMSKEKYDLARKMFDKAITPNSDFAEYRKLRGDCLLKMGHVDGAIKDFKEVAKKDPKKENRRYLIEVLLNHAKFDEAHAETRDLDDDGQELAKLGTSFFQKKFFTEAIDCYTEAINKNRTEASYYKQRGNCFWEVRDVNKAIEDYKQVLLLSPADSDNRRRLSQLLFNSERYSEAVDVAFGLPHSHLLGLANDLFRKGQFKEASRCYTEAGSKNVRNPALYKDRGYCYWKTGHLDWAIHDYQTLIELMPYNVPRKIDLCEMLIEANRVEECVEVLKLVNEDNVTGAMKARIVKAHQKIKEFQEAQEKANRKKLFNYARDLIIRDIARRIQKIREGGSLQSQDVFQEGEKRIRELELRCADLLRKLQHAFDVYNTTGVPLEAEKPVLEERDLPNFLQDPISLDAIKDPYTSPGGHTYDREIIWLALQTQGLDPLTRRPLNENQLRPNLAMREAILLWNEEKELDAEPSTS